VTAKQPGSRGNHDGFAQRGMAVHARCGALLCALGRAPARADVRDARPRSQHTLSRLARFVGRETLTAFIARDGRRGAVAHPPPSPRDACSAVHVWVVVVCCARQAHVQLRCDTQARQRTHSRTTRPDMLRLRDALQYASRGAKEFVTELVPALKSEFPHVDLVVEAKRGKIPFIEGFYKNGRSKPIGVCLYIYSVCVYVYMYAYKAHTHTKTGNVLGMCVCVPVRVRVRVRVRVCAHPGRGWDPCLNTRTHARTRTHTRTNEI